MSETPSPHGAPDPSSRPAASPEPTAGVERSAPAGSPAEASAAEAAAGEASPPEARPQAPPAAPADELTVPLPGPPRPSARPAAGEPRTVRGGQPISSVLERLGLARIEPPAAGRATAPTGPAPSLEARGDRPRAGRLSRPPIRLGPARVTLLMVVLAAAGVPGLVLAWRAALAPVPSGSSVAGGVLVVAGLAFLAVAGVSLAGESHQGRHDAEAGGWTAVLSRPPVLLALLGVVLLAGAVAAVRCPEA